MSWRAAWGQQRFVVGAGVVDADLAGAVAELHAERVAVLFSRSAKASGLVDRAIASLARAPVAVMSDIPSHAPIARTNEIAETLAGMSAPPDLLLAIGGGSVSDTAKGVAVLLAEGGELEQHCSTFTPPDRLDSPVLSQPKLPLVCIPTTLSAAEITPGAGATNASGTKRVFWDPQVAARMVLYDVDALADVPTDIVAATAMNAVAHCAEGLYSRTRNPLTDSLAAAGLRHLSDGLSGLSQARGGTSAMAQLATGTIMSGLIISQARVGLHHAICHVLGARLGVPHGVANSIMLAHVLEYNRTVAPAAFDIMAEALQVPSPANVPRRIAELRDAVQAPQRLRDANVRRADLSVVAEETMQDRGLFFNPRLVEGPEEVERLLEAAW
jgi:alcohol dehydrogenase